MGTTATRTWRNDITNSGRALQDVTQHFKAEGFSVSAIESLDLDMGNLCNLAQLLRSRWQSPPMALRAVSAGSISCPSSRLRGWPSASTDTARSTTTIGSPVKWSEIDRNIREFIASGTCQPHVNMTVQAYNVLSIVALATYCDSVGIELRYHLLQHPNYLSVGVLPDAARAIAVERLRSHPPLKPATLAMLKELAGVIEAVKPCGQEAVDQFRTFTAELEASCGQLLARSIPELASLLRPNQRPVAEAGDAPPREVGNIFTRMDRVLKG